MPGRAVVLAIRVKPALETLVGSLPRSLSGTSFEVSCCSGAVAADDDGDKCEGFVLAPSGSAPAFRSMRISRSTALLAVAVADQRDSHAFAKGALAFEPFAQRFAIGITDLRGFRHAEFMLLAAGRDDDPPLLRVDVSQFTVDLEGLRRGGQHMTRGRIDMIDSLLPGFERILP